MKTILELHESAMMLRAVVVYAHTADLPRAYRWCEEHRYSVVALVPKQRFIDAVRLVSAGAADLIVAASEDSLDPDRLPRVEVVPDEDDSARDDPA